MKARAKSPHRHIRAFAGHVFVNYEWRPVPDGGDDEAKRLVDAGYLEIYPEARQVELVPAKPEPKPVVKVDATRGAITLATQHNIDLAGVKGSGRRGRIQKPDVQALLDADEEE